MQRKWLHSIWAAEDEEDEGGMGWWFWILVFLALEILLIRWIAEMQREAARRARLVDQAQREVDDLRRLEGIGPKVRDLLHNAGIQTYAQLAASSEEELREVLRSARLYMINPSTWPEQAALAAKGDWRALETLKGQLRGGSEA